MNQPFLTQPPDVNTRVPRNVLPAGAVDAHFHLFGPASRHPFDPGSKYLSADVLPDAYVKLQAILGLERGVLVSAGAYGTRYEHLLESLAALGPQFRGVALLKPTVSRTELDVLHNAGVRGTRCMSPAHGGSIPVLDHDLARKTADYGWHIQFYPHGTDLTESADILLSLPNTIVLDHFGHIPAHGGVDQPAFRTLLRMLDTGRVWVKISGLMRCTPENPPYASVNPLATALIRYAPERLVWGTDWPHANMNGRVMPNDGDLVDTLCEWAPDSKTLHKILVSNPEALYGFDPVAPQHVAQATDAQANS